MKFLVNRRYEAFYGHLKIAVSVGTVFLVSTKTWGKLFPLNFNSYEKCCFLQKLAKFTPRELIILPQELRKLKVCKGASHISILTIQMVLFVSTIV